MVPFWVPIIMRHLIFRVPKQGTVILTTTHMNERNSCDHLPIPVYAGLPQLGVSFWGDPMGKSSLGSELGSLYFEKLHGTTKSLWSLGYLALKIPRDLGIY